MQGQHASRLQGLLNHKKKVEFHNNRRQFELDRLIQEYEADLRSQSQKQSPSKVMNGPTLKLQRSIKISPLRAEEPPKRYKRKKLQLQSLEPYKSNHELGSHLRFKTLSTRYKPDSQDKKIGSKSIELQSRSLKRNQGKQLLQSLRVKKNKHTSLVTLEQRINESNIRSKSKEQKGVRWSHRTRRGYHPSDPQKPNQDEYLIKMFRNSKMLLFAVADGHGTNGHLVSEFIVRRLQGLLEHESNNNLIMSLSRTYNKLQDELFKTNLFDVMMSGSTLITAIIDYPKLVCANAGDSRAVLVRKLDKQSWELVSISEDHKPSLPKERRRIIKKGGKIHSCKDEEGFSVGPLRVWLPNKDKPGLAMSRSLGDNLCKSIGVTHEPQIIELQIESEDKFLIIGSDGVWQNVSSNQILNFLVPLYNQGRLQQCCDTLLHLCMSSSIKKPNDPIDDITFIIVFLNKPT